MSDNVNPGIYSLTVPAVMIFPQLFEARAFGSKGHESGTPKFSAKFMFNLDHPDLVGIKRTVAAVARAKWPGRDLKELAFPLVAGDKMADKRKQATGKDDGDFQRGKVVVTARSKFEPRLSAIVGGKLYEYDGPARVANKDKFYMGVEVLAQFNFVAYKGVGANPDGVNAYLNMVLSTGKGERLGNAPVSAAEAFAGYVGRVSEYNPTEGYDAEMPF